MEDKEYSNYLDKYVKYFGYWTLKYWTLAWDSKIAAECICSTGDHIEDIS